MSRGPGIWQRKILAAIDRDGAVVLTTPGSSPAVQNAIRRAAYTLEAAGKIKLTAERFDGRHRIIACALDSEIPDPRIVTSLNGKQYRLPPQPSS